MDTNDQINKPFVNLDPKKAIIALLACADEKNELGKWNWNAAIAGRTRLVKELFLIQKETKSGSEGLFSFIFTPGPYGPSSLQVTNSLNLLIQSKYISETPLPSGLGTMLTLTEAGLSNGLEILKSLPRDSLLDIYRIKSKIKKYSYRQLLSYVYRAYPDYTVNSRIKNQVLGENP